MKANNERKKYFATNTNTITNNRFFSENQSSTHSSNYNFINRQSKFKRLISKGYLARYTENSRANPVLGSIPSGKSFLTNVREISEEQNFDSGSNFSQNYNKHYLDFNRNFNNNYNPNSSTSFSAKSKKIFN